MWWWRANEDQRPAGGFKAQAFGGNFVSEELIVLGLPPRFAIFKRASLVIRAYDDGRMTMAESEWREGL